MSQEDLGEEIGKLGFGLMRLPKKRMSTDVAQTSEMVDLFLDAGFTYFDTAHVYGDSESTIRKALVERYPRDAYQLATKLNAWMGARNEKSAKKQFQTSLERTGAGYFDFYLLHGLMANNYTTFDDYHIWDYVRGLKEQGLVRHWGFSYHAGPELLDRLLSAHPDTEFVQLQLNYADWESSSVQARANYEVARAHGKPIVVMEPVKGGALANPPAAAREAFREIDPDASYASWAIRFAASLDGVVTVLSGMSDVSQMRDNLSFMKDFKPLDERERMAVRRAQEAFGSSPAIPCTACRYCEDGCPVGIAIHDMIAALNARRADGLIDESERMYAEAAAGAAACDCVACGQCESACPQHLPIISHLEECARAFGR